MIKTAEISTAVGKYIDYWCFANFTRLELLANREKD